MRERSPLLRRRALAVIAAVALAGIAGNCTMPERVAREPAPDEPTLRVMSYNVNFGLAGDAEAIDAIRSEGADLVLLQETNLAWERALRREHAPDYAHLAFRHSRGAGGLAVLSRFPFEEKDLVAAPTGWFPAWRVVVDSPLGPLQVLQVHLHPPVSESGSYVSGYLTTGSLREREIAAFEQCLDDRLPALVAGDFNEDEDGAATRRLTARGFRSALPEFQPGIRTWRWQTSAGEITLRLDHIFYDRALEPLEARVVEAGRSDHLPIVARFALARAGRASPRRS